MNETTETKDLQEQPGTIKSFSTPRLTPEERLYVRAYLSTLSHKLAHERVCPDLKAHQTNNKFAKSTAVQFHISLALQEKAEALSISPDLIIEKLFKEAIREGPGSNHAARIQALVQLGKHLGLFEEKKEDKAFTFNIVNYSTETKSIDNSSESLKSVEQPTTFLDNVEITDYSEEGLDGQQHPDLDENI